MQNEDTGRVHEKGEAESRLDPRLGSAGDEELDSGNLFDEPSQHREDSRRWFLILALVKRVNHYDRRNVCRLQWLDNQPFHLVVQRLVDDVRVGLEKRDEVISEVGIFVGKLESESGEYEVQVATVLEVSGTEKGSSQNTIGEDTLGDGLSDG